MKVIFQKIAFLSLLVFIFNTSVMFSQDKKILRGHKDNVISLSFSMDGKYLYSSCDDGTLKFWNAGNGILTTSHNFKSSTFNLNTTPPGYFFIIGIGDTVLQIHNLLESKRVGNLEGHTKPVTSYAFHPSGKFIATASKDNTIRIWDINSLKTIKVIKSLSDNVIVMLFSPDGRTLACGTEDGAIKIWEMLSIAPEFNEWAIKYDIAMGLDISINQDREAELKMIEDKFRPKGEFETTEEYNKRIEEATKEKIEIETKFSQKLSDLKTQKRTELDNASEFVKAERERKIQASIKDTTFKVERLGNYNADDETYVVFVNSMSDIVKIPRSEALTFKENWHKAIVKAKKKLSADLNSIEFYDIVIVHPITKKEYKFR